jgi:hypothetical protein
MNHFGSASQPSQFSLRHPQAWTTSDVREWLHSKNVSETIAASFKTANITGRRLLNITDSDLFTILGSGGRVADLVSIKSLIDELNAQVVGDVGYGGDVGYPNLAHASSSGMMESGKGLQPTSDIHPPTYERLVR